MTEDLIRGLRQLQQRVLRLQESIARAEAAVPSQARATDRTGAVEVALDRDGLPKSVEVADDWQHRLGQADFGEAVVEASQAAAAERIREPLRAFRDAPGPRTPSGTADGLDGETISVPSEFVRTKVAHARPRSVDTLAEEVLAAFDRIPEIAAASPLTASGTGRDRSGHVTVVLSRSGLLSCTADPEWLSHRPGRVLAAAVEQAVGAARAHLERTIANLQPADVDRLWAEALAFLGDPDRLANS